jgi:predicted TIM-barrel fold metal-dependent hydrolase
MTVSSPEGERYIVISADCHAGASIDDYRDFLEAEYWDEFDSWREAYRNPFQDLKGDRGSRNWDSERRTVDLETDGIVGEVVFPNTVPPFFPTGAVVARPPSSEEYRLRRAGVRAHNRWLAQWCAEQPDRRAGVAQIFLNDIDDAVEDVRFAAAKGLRGGILLPAVPPDAPWLEPLYSPAYDRVWQVCEDLEVVVNHHSGGGTPDYGDYPAASIIWLAETAFFSRRALTHLIAGGVFDRFPKLRFVMTEQGGSWVPSALSMLDVFYSQIAPSGRFGELAVPREAMLEHLPSEYFARNCAVAVSFPSPKDARARHAIGMERFLWGSDYPHAEGTFPHSVAALRRSFAGVVPTELDAILAKNPATVYGFDLDRLAPLAARVGPLVSEVAQPLDKVPPGTMSPAFYRD